MKNILPGLKTKINGWVMALVPVAAMMGWQIDADVIIKLVDDFSGWIASGYLLFGAANHYFRNLANK